MPRLALALALAVALTGCYVQRAIRIDDIPRVADGFDRPSGPPVTLMMPDGFGGMRTTSVQPIDRSTVRLRAPDGSTFVARGQLALIVTTHDGERLRFDAPVSVTTEPDAYYLTSPSQTGRLPTARVRRAEVRYLSLGRTIAATVGISLAVTAVALVPLVAL